jgi:hypothetical protein
MKKIRVTGKRKGKTVMGVQPGAMFDPTNGFRLTIGPRTSTDEVRSRWPENRRLSLSDWRYKPFNLSID